MIKISEFESPISRIAKSFVDSANLLTALAMLTDKEMELISSEEPEAVEIRQKLKNMQIDPRAIQEASGVKSNQIQMSNTFYDLLYRAKPQTPKAMLALPEQRQKHREKRKTTSPEAALEYLRNSGYGDSFMKQIVPLRLAREVDIWVDSIKASQSTTGHSEDRLNAEEFQRFASMIHNFTIEEVIRALAERGAKLSRLEGFVELLDRARRVAQPESKVYVTDSDPDTKLPFTDYQQLARMLLSIFMETGHGAYSTISEESGGARKLRESNVFDFIKGFTEFRRLSEKHHQELADEDEIEADPISTEEYEAVTPISEPEFNDSESNVIPLHQPEVYPEDEKTKPSKKGSGK